MFKLVQSYAALPALLLLAGTCLADTPEAAKFYKLDFVVKEVEGGKVVNSRSYSMIVSTGSRPCGSIRTDSKVQVPSSPGSSQYTYTNVGTRVDCGEAQEIGGGLALKLNADVSSLLQDSAANPPVVRSNQWSSTALVPLNKPTTVYSSDDVSSKRVMQLEVTANLVK